MPRSSRQRQTRLTFTPVPSSSPAAKGYHKQIQDRAAAVTLSSSPRSTRSIFSNNAAKQTDAMVKHAMPTPASEDGTRMNDAQSDHSSDSEPVRRHSQQRKGSQVKTRQRQIDFSNARDPSTFSPPMRLSSPSTKPRSSARSSMFRTQQGERAIVNISSDAGSEEELPSARKLVAQRRKSTKEKQKSARTTRSQAVPEASDEEDDTIIVKAKSSPILVESDDDDDEDDMPTTTGIKRRKRVTRRSSPDRDSFIASSPPQMTDSDDDLEIVAPPSKRRRRHRSDSDEDEDEIEVLAPTKKLSQREKTELDEDLDFLGPSSDIEASARKPRSSQSASKNARQKALEALKRKRSGHAGGQAAPQARQTSIEDSEEDNADDSDHEEGNHDPLERVQATRSSQMFREDEDDTGFIASDGDEDDLLGVPEGLPLEFTRYASMKAKELFKFAVEWFVHKKINPAFQMDDDIYELTFRKLDDEVSGLAGSKFKSAAWRDEFIYTLNARPDIAFDSIDRNEPEHAMRDTCDACNRTGHPPTFQVQFLGRPYHRQTLEDLAGNAEDDDDASDSDSDNSNEPNWDAEGHPIPPETKSWYLGKFCMSNTRTAHALQHWRYHLNTWVISWLDGNGYNTSAQVLKRDSMSTKKRRKYANRIADEMEAQGVVKQLYRDYRSNIDDARNSKQGRHVRGWD